MPSDSSCGRPAPGPALAMALAPARRSLLLATLGGVAALAGCGVDWDAVRRDDLPTPSPPRLEPQDVARFAAVGTIDGLRKLALALTSDPAGVGQRAAEQHARQLMQLGPLPGPVPAASATPWGWPSSSRTQPQPSTLQVLSQAEAVASAELLAGAVTTGRTGLPGPLARLLASLAASCAAHGVLTGGRAAALELSAGGALSPSGATGDLMALIEADRAAAYAYGVLTVHLQDGPRESGRQARSAHRQRSETLAGLALDAGADVPPAGPAYAVQAPQDAAGARALALRLELDVAAAAGALVSSAAGGWRTLGAHVLVQATVAAVRWGEPPAFPGIPELV